MKLTQAILPVAGLGTRFLPWTKVMPKEMLPIGNQPIIGLLVDECLGCGIREVCFVINRGKEVIPEYFAENPALEEQLKKRGKTEILEQLRRYDEVKFHVVYQDEQLGDGHAILQAQKWVKSPVIAVLFGDDLIAGKESGLAQLTKAYGTMNNDAVMLCLEDVARDRVSKYGIVAVDDAGSKATLKKIKGLVEKPKPDDAPSTLGIVGKYLIPASTIDMLATIEHEVHQEIRLIDAFKKQLGTTPIYGCVVEGKRLDTGTPEGYKEAVKVLG